MNTDRQHRINPPAYSPPAYPIEFTGIKDALKFWEKRWQYAIDNQIDLRVDLIEEIEKCEDMIFILKLQLLGVVIVGIEDEYNK